MKRFFRILSIALLCGALSAPAISAQRHGGNNGGRERTTHSNRGNNGGSRSPQNNRPANSSRPNNNGGATGRPGIGNQRPGNKDHGVTNGNNNNHRPNFGNGNNNNNNRPNVGNGNHNNNRPNVGNGNHNNNRPNVGNGNHNNNRPNVGNGNHNNNRPNVGNGNHGSTGRPGLGTTPDHNKPNYGPNRPNNGNHNWNQGNRPPAQRPPYMAPPRRPYRPNMYRPHYRPTPPPHWRPARGIPAIRGILGITFGTTIGLSLDYLYNSGYTVDGYGNDVVYLRNVNQLNYIWTDAALYYGANGFDASSFYYATPVYDLTRYNAVYNNLVALYGQPISINSAGQLGATWFGGNQGYITLSFGASNVAGGALRYLTTLTFGL